MLLTSEGFLLVYPPTVPTQNAMKISRRRRLVYDQQQKNLSFRQAHKTINHYVEQQNWVAAYVIGFSILEDRVRTLCIKGRMIKENSTVPPAYKWEPLTKVLNEVRRLGYIDQPTSQKIKQEIDARNSLLHDAMWELDAFTEQTFDRVKELLTKVDRARRAQNAIFKKIGAA